MNHPACIGSLLGTAVGDALGLPYEGLSPRRGAKLFPDSAQHHLLPSRGMVSDDTEHACFTAAALIRCQSDVGTFRKLLARSLRWWFAALPAGVGFATARAILKLWLGISPERSGVHSAGNGPAMRAPILGVVLGADTDQLKRFVRASTAITHRDPKAYQAALAVALAAHQSAGDGETTPESFRATLANLLAHDNADEFLELVAMASRSAAAGEPVSTFAATIGSRNGISGYSFHTVPCVLQAWFRHPDDFAAGLQDIIKAGGDTDTAGAIFGGIAGARAHKDGIPAVWRDNIVEWPRSVRWIEALGNALANTYAKPAVNTACPRYFWPGIIVRNALFLIFVLSHGLRRLLPPY